QAPFYCPDTLRIQTAAPIAGGAGRRIGRLAALKELRWVRTLHRYFGPAVSSLSGRSNRRLMVPYEGNGYQDEAAEVMRCLREGRQESPTMPLDETVDILETMDELRRQWGWRLPNQ